MLFGFCEKDITPDKPSVLVGFYRPDNLSKGIDKPLIAQVAVWKTDYRSCLITIDSLGFTKELTDEVRKCVSDALDISAKQVMVCFSHTHSAPNAFAMPEYFTMVCERLVEAAKTAVQNLKPILVGWGNARAEIGVNRRPISNDVDDRVGILKVCDEENHHLQLLILRVTAHANSYKRDNYLISPDFFGAVRELVGEKYHCPVMVIQGSAGNTAPKYYWSEEVPIDGRDCICSNTATYDMANVISQSLDQVMDDITIYADCSSRIHSEYIQLTSKVPDKEEAFSVAKEAKELGGIDGDSWLERVEQLREKGILKQTETIEIQYFSVGDWCICGGPYEFMVGFALETTKRLNDEFFYMNGYTNGCLLYFPTEDEFDYGGYEVYWSMLIYYLYMERVFPYDREAATKLIQFVVEKRGKQMKLFGEE